MIKRITIEQLDIGMFVVGLDQTWMDTPFLSHKFLIETKEQIDKLKKYNVTNIDIDTDKGKDHKEAVSIEVINKKIDEDIEKQIKIQKTGLEPDKVSFEEEMVESKKIHGEVRRVVEDTMMDARIGQNVDVEKLNTVVDSMIESLYRNKNTLLSLSRLKSYDAYTFHHSVNVAILALAMGRHMGYSKEDLQILGVGGLLHDLGKTMIPESILNKPGKLTEEEFDMVKNHVNYGVDIVSKTEDVHPESLKIVQDHHERYNGKGYQRGLKGEELSKFNLITGIADSYDAITTDRPYKKGKLPYEALREIFTLKDFFPQMYLEKFIQCMGIFPVGSIVRLNSKEIGIVIMVNHAKLIRPKVRIIFDKLGNRIFEHKVCNLNIKKLSGDGYLKDIVGVIDPKEIGVDPNSYINYLP